MSQMKSVNIRMEVTNDDGSKTIVTIPELDASGIRMNSHPDDTDHLMIGVVDPFYDQLTSGGDAYFDSFTRYKVPAETHFSLDLQLAPLDPSPEFYYQIEAVPTNATEVVLAVKPDGSIDVMPISQREAASFMDLFPELHFFLLDIP